MSDPYNLERFINAQTGTFDRALSELKAGAKQSHWMWFIFPQLRGLGRSPTAQFYGIVSFDEAQLYVEHALLGPRLSEAVEAVLRWRGKRTAEQIFGSVDALKLRSSMTLFDLVRPGTQFAQALDGFYRGERDQRTLALLNAER